MKNILNWKNVIHVRYKRQKYIIARKIPTGPSISFPRFLCFSSYSFFRILSVKSDNFSWEGLFYHIHPYLLHFGNIQERHLWKKSKTLTQFPKFFLPKKSWLYTHEKSLDFFSEMTLAQFPKSDFLNFRWIFFPKMTLAQFPVFGFFSKIRG